MTANHPDRTVGLVWAQTPRGVIGSDNTIPWRVPEDMARFKAVTMGHPVVMGRRTWDSLPERFRPLPGRRNIVVSRRSTWTGAGAQRVGSVEEALRVTLPEDVWVIGGGEIYRLALPHATELLITEVDSDIHGDTYAPALGPEWHTRDDDAWARSSGGPRYRIRRFVRT